MRTPTHQSRSDWNDPVVFFLLLGRGPRLSILLHTRPAIAEAPPHDTQHVLHLYNFGVALDLERQETRLHLTMRELASQVL